MPIGNVTLVDKKTDKRYPAVQWTGNNGIEVKQFGRTADGTLTKLTCTNVLYAKLNGQTFFSPIKRNDYIALDMDSKYMICIPLDELSNYREDYGIEPL